MNEKPSFKSFYRRQFSLHPEFVKCHISGKVYEEERSWFQLFKLILRRLIPSFMIVPYFWSMRIVGWLTILLLCYLIMLVLYLLYIFALPFWEYKLANFKVVDEEVIRKKYPGIEL